MPDSVCVFDGLESVKERCAEWFSQKKSEKLAGELLREDERGPPAGLDSALEVGKDKKKIVELEEHVDALIAPLAVGIPEGIEIIVAEPITDRKSAFVGRACRITDPAQVCLRVFLMAHFSHGTHFQVPLILSHLMSDRRIARAAHPIINAWRCQVGNTMHQGSFLKLSRHVKITEFLQIMMMTGRPPPEVVWLISCKFWCVSCPNHYYSLYDQLLI